MRLPSHLWFPQDPFIGDYEEKSAIGGEVMARSTVAFVGLARNCAAHLAKNLCLAKELGEHFKSWSLHVETNDNDDDTDQVLSDFCSTNPTASFHSQRLGRRQFNAEFAGPRTIALAEYRSACQQWVANNHGDSDYVIVIDFDQWGGWNQRGVLHGVGWLHSTFDAFGMSSVSLLETQTLVQAQDGSVTKSPLFVQYDCWALRLNCYWDDYSSGQGGWKHYWLPAVGSPPARVCSAFGGLTVYRTDAYLAGRYDGESDCEHVPFHRSISEATGQSLYLCPGMRCVMQWMEPA